MKLALTEVYEVATFYAHFDVVKDGAAAAGRHRARVQFIVLRHGRRREAAGEIAGDPRQGGARACARPAWAPAIARRSPRSAMCRPSRRRPTKSPPAAKANPHAHAWHPGADFAAYQKAGGYALLKDCLSGKRTRDDADQDRQRRRPARHGRRRLSHRAQMVAGARRAGAAPVGGQCRRRRARHLQGSLLSRARSASLHRGHADRRLGGRGARHLPLHPRRISGTAADAGRGDRQGRSRRPRARTPSCICGAAPALISAAKSRR